MLTKTKLAGAVALVWLAATASACVLNGTDDHPNKSHDSTTELDKRNSVDDVALEAVDAGDDPAK
ncbi:MAG TPA: hypothetical protein VF407_06495 [Polyangiaceae bacterium]